MLKSIVIIGLCILLSLVLVSADTETMFIIGGDTETYFVVPMDTEIGLITPGTIPIVGGGGSPWPNYNVNLTVLPINVVSRTVPVSIVVDNPGASLVNANWTLSLYDPRGILVQKINFISDLPSGRHIIYQNVSLSQALLQGLWSADVVLNTDLQRVADQKNFTILNAGTTPTLAFFPPNAPLFNTGLLKLIILAVMFMIILWLIFGKRRKKRGYYSGRG